MRWHYVPWSAESLQQKPLILRLRILNVALEENRRILDAVHDIDQSPAKTWRSITSGHQQHIHKDTAFLGLIGGLSSVRLLIYLFLCSLVDHFINCLMKIPTKPPCRGSNPEADYHVNHCWENTNTNKNLIFSEENMKKTSGTVCACKTHWHDNRVLWMVVRRCYEVSKVFWMDALFSMWLYQDSSLWKKFTRVKQLFETKQLITIFKL